MVHRRRGEVDRRQTDDPLDIIGESGGQTDARGGEIARVTAIIPVGIPRRCIRRQ